MSCDHCFHFQTLNEGRRMIVERCGGLDCVSIVQNNSLKHHEPTKKFNLEQCGMIKGNSYSMVNKALQVKVSTNVENTLRPGEYPWLVSFLFLFYEKQFNL